ncbi:aldehyde dehydrogenase (NADP(+)) [Arthrobacter pigmenti]
MSISQQTASTDLAGVFLIGSSDVHGGQGELRGVNPRTGGELEPAYGLGGRGDVDRAVTLATEAFAGFRATDAETRAGFLERIAAEIEAVAEPIAERVIAETGIAQARAQGELARTTNQLRLFAAVVREGNWRGVRVDRALPDRTPMPRPDLRQRQIPLGPVAVFSASNFPLAFSVAGGDTASALSAGCPVVVKGHSAHPGVSELVARAVRSAVQACGLPEGTFSMLLGTGPGLGTDLVSHPGIKAVGFTGSRSGGLALVEAAARRAEPIPVYAEMSSVNPVFMLSGALDARGAALGKEFITSINTGAGQLCTSPGLVFALEGSGLDAFLESAAEAVGQSPASPMLNSGIQSGYQRGIERLAGPDGVSLIASGGQDDSIAACGQTHLFTTDAGTFLSNPELAEEAFGAASLVVRVSAPSQLLEIIAKLEGQLTATIHAEPDDYDQAAVLLPELELLAGRVLFNGWPTGVEVGHAVVHGGPFPATSAPSTTSVGSRAIERFLRPVSYQNVPAELLPVEVRDGNPLGLWRQVEGGFGQS